MLLCALLSKCQMLYHFCAVLGFFSFECRFDLNLHTEPSISLDAIAGNLELRVQVDPYLRQQPTVIELQNTVSRQICGIAPAKLGMCELFQTLEASNCTTSYLWRKDFFETVSTSGCFVELAPSTRVSGKISVKLGPKSMDLLCVLLLSFF